jgi:threonine aldolase
VLLESEAHIFFYEAGGIGVLSGCQPRTIPGDRGRLDPDLVSGALRPPNIHYPPTTLLCLENTHNRGGGSVTSLEAMEGMCRVAREAGIRVHLDGARIFNAAAALGMEARQIAEHSDSVMFCLSKGLSAPVGSMLCGSADWIARARRNRKVLGGGMRQAGIIAAAGLVALTTMVDRLVEDHQNARKLATGLSLVKGVSIDPSQVETNILIFGVPDSQTWVERLSEKGVLCNATAPKSVRMVTHKDVSSQDIDEVLKRVREITLER